MTRLFSLITALLIGGAVTAATASEIKFDFGLTRDGGLPPGFVSQVSGPGKANLWKTMDEAMASMLSPVGSNDMSGLAAMHTVLVGLPRDAEPNRAGILLYTNELFADFTFATRFKIASGAVTPEAGVAFRAQDENNYYVIRARAQGNLLWYRVVGGVRYEGNGIGVRVPIAADAWHDLRVECSGNSIRGFLDNRLLIPPVKEGAPTNDVAINDNTFAAGRIGFWTGGDATASFSDARIDFAQRVPVVQTVILNVMKKYSRMLSLKVYGMKGKPEPVVIADGKGEGLGEAGGKTEAQVLKDGQVMYLKTREYVEVTQPLRDRNGEVVAALRTRMTTFPGETQDTGLTRALQIKKAVEEGLATMEDINN